MGRHEGRLFVGAWIFIALGLLYIVARAAPLMLIIVPGSLVAMYVLGTIFYKILDWRKE